ncbi:MAG: sigma-70 family RNA polymerase sigma factor [Lachnospiraceae bacterium]|nr:sigma-70 family RNA polymerase sigma factor [Lachnospiraceae bacterium]
MREQELFNLIRQDPNSGFEKLMSEYGALAASVARGLLLPAGLDEADVEDCLAESLVELYRKRDGLDPEKGSLKALFCSIARHKALDKLRSRRESVPLESLPERPDGLSLEERFAEEDLRERVLAAVKALPEPEREILLRKYYLGQSSKEIAEKLGLKPGTVDVKAHRAVRILKARLGEEENE